MERWSFGLLPSLKFNFLFFESWFKSNACFFQFNNARNRIIWLKKHTFMLLTFCFWLFCHTFLVICIIFEMVIINIDLIISNLSILRNHTHRWNLLTVPKYNIFRWYCCCLHCLNFRRRNWLEIIIMDFWIWKVKRRGSVCFKSRACSFFGCSTDNEFWFCCTGSHDYWFTYLRLLDLFCFVNLLI